MWNKLQPARNAHVTALLCELHRICFQVGFKVLIMTYKATPGIGTGYLKDYLFLRMTTLPVSSKFSTLLVPLIMQCHMLEPRKHAFSFMMLAFWNEVPQRMG